MEYAARSLYRISRFLRLANRPNYSLADRVRLRAAWRRFQDVQPEHFDRVVQVLGEDVIVIVNQVSIAVVVSEYFT